jgi:voltage-gated potassium channel
VGLYYETRPVRSPTIEVDALTPDPSGTRRLLRHAWDALILVATLFAAFTIPLRIVLAPIGQPLTPGLDMALTALYGVDLVIRTWGRAKLPTSRRRAWWGTAIDLVAALPFGRILGLPAGNLLRLVKLARVFSLITAWRRRMVIHPTVVRLVGFIVWLSLSAHWLACGWIVLGGPTHQLGIDNTYISALYWCVTTLTTVGYGDVTPQTANQAVYTMIVMLLGVGVYGYVIGNVANLLSKMDMARAQYVATIERVTGFLRYRLVPAPLQREIYAYYKYLWENRMGYDEASVLDDLPPSLSAELSLVLKRDLIQKIDFLRDASASLIKDLCIKLRPVVFTPGDVVLRAGEIGRHVYFISKGTVEVITSDGRQILRTLSDGDFFGELALIHSQPRTATVRAVGYCDFYVLDKDSFRETLTRYPEFERSIREISDARTLPGDGTASGPPRTPAD